MHVHVGESEEKYRDIGRKDEEVRQKKRDVCKMKYAKGKC